MKKYAAFLLSTIKEELANIISWSSTIFSFCVHIIIFSFLWEFVLEGKALKGFSKEQLVWYVILAEAITYSFHYYYKKIAHKIEMGDFAYGMSKPYNFLLRCVMEGLAEVPITVAVILVGVILGCFLAGPINITVFQGILIFAITCMAIIMLLLLNILVGMLSIWVGRDVSSIWLLIGKMMLIFAFTPLELFPKWVQIPLLILPTTHVIYTPAKLLVHFSNKQFLMSLLFESGALLIISVALAIIYMKGVRKQNVEGV